VRVGEGVRVRGEDLRVRENSFPSFFDINKEKKMLFIYEFSTFSFRRLPFSYFFFDIFLFVVFLFVVFHQTRVKQPEKSPEKIQVGTLLPFSIDLRGSESSTWVFV
jgi:hypothetical protein